MANQSLKDGGHRAGRRRPILIVKAALCLHFIREISVMGRVGDLAVWGVMWGPATCFRGNVGACCMG